MNLRLNTKVPMFRKFADYRNWAREILFPHPVFLNNRIVSNLIDWVLYNSAPIFYWVENEEERLAYLGCYRIIPIVHPEGPYLGNGDRYSDPVIVGLTHLHEFAHNLFSYPYSLKDTTPEDFDFRMQEKEWAASNFTEIVAYYLIPELDELTKGVYFRPGWYDRMKELNLLEMPKIAQLHNWRKDWLKNPGTYEDLWAPGDKYAGLRKYMRRFIDGNEDFNVSRLQLLLNVEEFADPGVPALEPTSYLSGLENFIPPVLQLSQLNYERLQLVHVKLLYRLLNLGNIPTTFSEALQQRRRLNNVKFVL